MITEFISVGIGGKLEVIKKELSEETISCRLSVSYSGVGIYQNVHRTLHLFVSLCKFTHLKKKITMDSTDVKELGNYFEFDASKFGIKLRWNGKFM